MKWRASTTAIPAYLEFKTDDWPEIANRVRAQIFPDIPLPAVDPVFNEIMRARAAAQKAKQPTEKGRQHAALI